MGLILGAEPYDRRGRDPDGVVIKKEIDRVGAGGSVQRPVRRMVVVKVFRKQSLSGN